jgi:rRNA maturation protein Nop10
MIRENTGNYTISGAFEAGEATKTPHPACAFSRNSLEIGTGNFE